MFRCSQLRSAISLESTCQKHSKVTRIYVSNSESKRKEKKTTQNPWNKNPTSKNTAKVIRMQMFKYYLNSTSSTWHYTWSLFKIKIVSPNSSLHFSNWKLLLFFQACRSHWRSHCALSRCFKFYFWAYWHIAQTCLW